MSKKPPTYFCHADLSTGLEPDEIIFSNLAGDGPQSGITFAHQDLQDLDSLPGYKTTYKYYLSLPPAERAAGFDASQASAAPSESSQASGGTLVECPCAQQCYFKCSKIR